MALRSWLIVPADNEAKLSKVPAAGADVVVLDLSSVEEAAKTTARGYAYQFLLRAEHQMGDRKRFARWVRINPIGSPHWKEDLDAAVAGKPDGIVLPRAMGSQQVQAVAAEIYELEQKAGAVHNSVRIVPQVGDAPEAALMMSQFLQDPHPRILGLGYDAHALASAMNLTGTDNDAVRAVRAQLLLTAKSRGLMAIESPSGLVRQTEALAATVDRARRNGFDAMMARHPAQIPVIEAGFARSGEELAMAAAIVAAFERMPEAQVLTVEGRSVDRIGLERAQRLLAEG